MQRVTAFCCVLQILGALAISQSTPFPVQAGGRLFPAPDVDSLLARPYASHVPMACVGQRVWAAHPEGWAFPSSVYYYALTPGVLGFSLDLRANGQPIAAVEPRAYPSHVASRGAAGRVSAEGWKWITHDDVLGALVRLRNDGDSAVSIEARLTLPLSSVDTLDGGTIAWTGNVSNLLVHCRMAADEFEPEYAAMAHAPMFWAEGESPTSQDGAGAPEPKAAAHGGNVLGGGFGAACGDTASWMIDVSESLEDGALAVRYARLLPGGAPYRIEFDGTEVSGRLQFRPTGGLGETESQFQVASFPLGAVAKGMHRITLETLEKKSNLNIDLIAIHSESDPFRLPNPPKRVYVRAVELPPGGEARVGVFAAASTRAEEADHTLARILALDDPLRDQVDSYRLWLTENVPSFTSENPALEKVYWHRATSVIRKNLFRLGEGRLSRWAMAEGRWNSEWFTNTISYGTGHHIRETRWLRDPLYVRDIISTWCENIRENGLFPSHIPPDGPVGGQYADWITSAVWDAHQVRPDIDALRAWAPALKRNIDGWLAEYDTDGDGLLLVDSHGWTGMEWQPSFFYFNGYDRRQQGQRLERVDLTSFVYGGARNLAAILSEVGDAEGSARYSAIASRIHDAVLKYLWDHSGLYFFSVEPETHVKAMVKEIAGIYPFYFAMFDAASEAGYAVAWRSVIDPEELWTAWPVASASRQCAAYSQDERFHGQTVGGCMWNGPTWPHANTLTLSAMAQTLREYPDSPLSLSEFGALLASYTNAQFLDKDLEFPWTGEFYNGDTGEWRTQERDYNHSSYLDILIADLAGLRPGTGESLDIRPLIEDHTPSFTIDGIRYHGHDVTIAWNRPAAPAAGPDGRTGFRVYVDGALLYTSPRGSAPKRVQRDLNAGIATVPGE